MHFSDYWLRTSVVIHVYKARARRNGYRMFISVYILCIRVIGTYFLKKVVTGNTQSEHLFRVCTACPDTKIKLLNHRPRVSNGLDTDHD